MEIKQELEKTSNDAVNAGNSQKGSLLFIIVAILLLLVFALIVIMENFNFAYIIPFVSIKTLGLVGISILLVGFGAYFKHAAAKVTLFCFVAVFMAFAFVNIYVDAKGPADVIRYVLKDNALSEDGLVISLEDARAIFKEFGKETSPEALTAPKMSAPDEKLGYHMVKNLREILAIKVMDKNKLVYLATYHLNKDGWRVTPEAPKAKKAIACFGDSFTFGLGLNDEESYPYKLGKTLGSNYKVLNFGIGGWGPHQALALIENGALDEAFKNSEELHVFFMPIDNHITRSVGEAFWDTDGPYYQLQPDGAVKFMGSFRSIREKNPQEPALSGQYSKSQKEQLVLAILRQIDNVVKERYGTRLVLINPFGYAPFAEQLEYDGIMVLDANVKNIADYTIPGDGHPNGLGTDLFTKRIVDYLQGQTSKKVKT